MFKNTPITKEDCEFIYTRYEMDPKFSKKEKSINSFSKTGINCLSREPVKIGIERYLGYDYEIHTKGNINYHFHGDTKKFTVSVYFNESSNFMDKDQKSY